MSTARVVDVPETEGTLPYLLATPPDGAPNGLIVVVHGRSRRARPLIEAFAGAATARGFAVAAPIFSLERYGAYQRLGSVLGPMAAADALSRTCDEIAGGSGQRREPPHLVGFSGGAQFAHRYALARPSAVRRIVVIAAGWYTMPDARAAYPHGLAPSGEAPEGLPRLEAFLRIPVRVMVGDGDVARDANLNTSPAVDEVQGPHRLERARRWVQAVHNAAVARGIASDIALEILPGAGHSARDAIRRSGLVARTLRFLEARPGGERDSGDDTDHGTA